MKHLKGIASIIIAVIFAASSVCAVQTVQVSAASKPAKVKSLTLKLDQANKQVKLSWKKARGAKKYQVYIKAPAAKWKKLKTVKATRATYQAANSGTYYFKVRGVKSSKKGKFSAVKSITLSSELWNADSTPAPTQSTKPSSGSTSNPGSSGSNPGGNSGSTTNPTNPGTNPGSTVLITRIGLQGNCSIYPGDSTTITASPYPSNATNKSVNWQVASYSGVTWSQNGNSVTIKTSKSTPAGSFNATATAKDGSGVTASARITIIANPIRGLSLINRHPVYDDSIPSYSGVPQAQIDSLFKLDTYADKQFLMVHVDTDLGSLSGDHYCWYNATTEKFLSANHETDASRDGRDHYSLLDVSYKSTSHSNRALSRGGLLYPLHVNSGDLASGNNVIQLWSAQYTRPDYTCLAVLAELRVNVKSRAAAYDAYARQILQNSRGYVSENDSLYKSKATGVTKNKDKFYQLYCAQEYIKANSEYWPSMSQSNSAAPLYTLATTGKFIDTHVGGCEDGAVLMTMCCLCAGISAQHAVPSNSSHKLCSVDNSETVFGKAGVTFDAQPPLGQYTMMTTESQYQAYVNSLTKIY